MYDRNYIFTTLQNSKCSKYNFVIQDTVSGYYVFEIKSFGKSKLQITYPGYITLREKNIINFFNYHIKSHSRAVGNLTGVAYYTGSDTPLTIDYTIIQHNRDIYFKILKFNLIKRYEIK